MMWRNHHPLVLRTGYRLSLVLAHDGHDGGGGGGRVQPTIGEGGCSSSASSHTNVADAAAATEAGGSLRSRT